MSAASVSLLAAAPGLVPAEAMPLLPEDLSVRDVLAGVLIVLGAFLSMAAGVGIVRFPDVLSRLHAGTKPQVLGLVAVLAAILLEVPSWGVLTTIVLILTFQLLTQPMTAHMLGRAAYRTDHVRRDLLIDDELADDIARRERAASRRGPERSGASDADGE
ncbi:monovalent cation/H(+) antiporter subunit G [Agromyces mangrovi Wang et al. 2018]|uniref:monovalent cation/H(+) antiporter subunit G n=1 Tax=Agromyces mangrovi TaxID=1858653 RepID=UPI00257422C2|nr:monovalent cation/H(+) antiporter subunit G [Agromyces mangrovi]BDZ64206.1 hypothetical protein GCM10025877_11440 [Agromyces mangrovi]